MTQIGEKIQIHLDNPDSEDCPFCPGKETKHEWKTFKGADNDGGILREAMNNPKRCNYAHQSGARPKDGKYPNQNISEERPSPSPIFENSEHGEYGNEAHHCISGNEIMKGHAIEKAITKGDKYKGDTGYTINNGDNGVFLPSYPKKYSGKWGVKSDSEKYKIMKLAMDAGKGQVHIGGHKGHGIDGYCESYPDEIKKRLTLLKDRVGEKSEECPFCVESSGKPKKPFVPPYKVNQWLDNLSKNIEKKLTSSPSTWPYFISKYAKKYFKELSQAAADPLDDL
ncbi:AHH domain-containing protein [Aliikangiella sp. G2MR2-5]|uniref:AHH domain-containing protein n=1 Tax=Aliikangiella sp. G2MR2-5 TaxID=2788943 RepID=UPI0018AB80CC|nr:AHH domain-containing protein [Aliikangiella sp. G2MR2-5]